MTAGDASPIDIVRMTWYVTDMETYRKNLKQIGKVWRKTLGETLGETFPCMACVEVVSLVELKAKIEIETTAVLPANKEK